MPATSLRNWAVGYSVKRVGAQHVLAAPLITTAPHRPGSRATVPFIGLAEAHTLLAFRAAGVPVQRIRPAIRWLEDHLGLVQALASERLMTAGAEVLYDFAAAPGIPTRGRRSTAWSWSAVVSRCSGRRSATTCPASTTATAGSA